MSLPGALAAVAAAVAVGLATDVDRADFRFTRSLTADADAPARFEPDGAMYAHTRPGFADLRVLDADANEVPWRPQPAGEALPPQPVRLVARGRLEGVVSVVVDRGPAAEVIDRLELEIPDDLFTGSVEVQGSMTGAEGSYATLSTTDIYSVRGAVDARSTTALFPPTDFRFLLVRARGVSDITGATVARDPRQPLLTHVAATSQTRQEPRSTVATLDLAFADVPVDAVQVRSTTPRFVRDVVVDGSNRAGGPFVHVGSGTVARFDGVDLDRVPVQGRHRYLRVTIDNGDDAALDSLSVEALARPRPLLLAEGFSPPYEVLYGSARVAAPAYDFALLPAGATGFERAVEGRLGAETRNDVFEPPADTRTFFERNRGLLNVLLVVAALVLAVGGVLALRRRT